MSRIKSSEIPHYELLYIISNKYSEDELGPIVDKVKNLIKENQGNITLSEEWGKKRLAYQIKSFYYGYYNLIEFDLAPDKLVKIDRMLRLMNEILRHQIVTKRIKTMAEIERDKKIAEKIAAKSVTEEKVAKEKVKTKEKVDLKDLDEKLKKILEAEDLL